MADLFCAIDTTDLSSAATMAHRMVSLDVGVKFGLEFFIAHGPLLTRHIAGQSELFLDLKLHDIPNTVAAAIRAAEKIEPAYMTLHASGSADMMAAAVQAARGSILLLAVTVLTSLDEDDLLRTGQIGPMIEQTKRLALLAQQSGLDGVVCSPWELATLRANCDENFLLVAPGVRPEGSPANDQKRVMTPQDAVAAGADILVVGRPITQAIDPTEAAQQILSQIS